MTEPLHAGVYESLRTLRLDAQPARLGDLVPHFADATSPRWWSGLCASYRTARADVRWSTTC